VLHIIDDVQELKPSFFVGVPRVYDKIYGKIVNLLPQQQGKMRWWLFRRAVASMEKTLRTGTPRFHLPLFFYFFILYITLFIIFYEGFIYLLKLIINDFFLLRQGERSLEVAGPQQGQEEAWRQRAGHVVRRRPAHPRGPQVPHLVGTRHDTTPFAGCAMEGLMRAIAACSAARSCRATA
jgi:hypothetical protein